MSPRFFRLESKVNHPFHEFPKHLYSDKPKHGELAKLLHVKETPTGIVVHNKEHELAARLDGYGDKYIHQEYPKHVKDSRGVTVTVNSADEEDAVLNPAETETGEEKIDPDADTK